MDAIIKELEIDLNHKMAIQKKIRTQRAELDRAEAQNEGAIMTVRDTIDKFKKRQLDPTTIARNIEEKAMQQRAKEVEEEKKKRAQQMKDEDEKKKQAQKLKEEEEKKHHKKKRDDGKHLATTPSSESCDEIPSDDSMNMMMANGDLDEPSCDYSTTLDKPTDPQLTTQKSKGRAKRTIIKVKH